ncbi:MAG: hypothetical protein JWR89_1690 [Tardiphaga sp.]|uniref:hypothetical protein n=1 Tax=Tardiphaga sp. TaxID=1926292 RepID=UPI002A1815F9|nr:hypothetical protein [Tardiphaga sp.]
MIKKYVSKFTIDILPSIIATIVGAYIVNHYIVPKSDAAKPAAATASTPDAKAASKSESKSAPKAANAKPAETSADVANVPDPASSKAKAVEKPADKASIEKPEIASTPAESRRHQPAMREKAVAKTTPAPAVVTPPAATASVAPVENAPTPEERRDANDLARAAIERLRNAKEAQPAALEAARVPEAPRLQDVSRTVTASPAQQQSTMQQLPPPIMVSTPSVETYGSRPPSAPAERAADSRRPRPPGEIPSPPPLDLQADATGTTRDRTTVAEDVLSAAKSVFHSVIPKQFER